MIEVRRAGPGDAEVLGEIHAAAWEAAYSRFFEPEFAARAVQNRRTRWHERIGEGAGTILLAALDRHPLALSVFLPSSTRPGLAEIYSFYGHPDGWGGGVAIALMTETLVLTTARSADTLIAEAVPDEPLVPGRPVCR